MIDESNGVSYFMSLLILSFGNTSRESHMREKRICYEQIKAFADVSIGMDVQKVKIEVILLFILYTYFKIL